MKNNKQRKNQFKVKTRVKAVSKLGKEKKGKKILKNYKSLWM